MSAELVTATVIQELRDALQSQVQGLNWLKGKSCLDVGCGPGVHAAALAFSGATIAVGVDITVAESELTRKRFEQLSNLEFVIGSVEHLPFATNSFDFVLCLRVLHHLLDADGALTELHRVLKVGGILYRGKSVST